MLTYVCSQTGLVHPHQWWPKHFHSQWQQSQSIIYKLTSNVVTINNLSCGYI
jgi:hypothetical protein